MEALCFSPGGSISARMRALTFPDLTDAPGVR
jgi:hypothetical protein